MITLHIHYNSRTEYRPMESLWAANLVAINAIRNDPRINYIHIVDNSTSELLKTYVG